MDDDDIEKDLGIGWHVFRVATNDWIIGLSHWDLAQQVVAGKIKLDDRAKYFNWEAQDLIDVGEIPKIKALMEINVRRKQSDLEFETPRQRQFYFEDRREAEQKQSKGLDQELKALVAAEFSPPTPKKEGDYLAPSNSPEDSEATNFAGVERKSEAAGQPLFESPLKNDASQAVIDGLKNTADDGGLRLSAERQHTNAIADNPEAHPDTSDIGAVTPSIPAAATEQVEAWEGTIVSYGAFREKGQIKLDAGAILSFKSEHVVDSPSIPDCPVGTRVEVLLMIKPDRSTIVSITLKDIKAFSPLPPKMSSGATVSAYKAELAELMTRSPRSVLASWSDIEVDPKGGKGNKKYGSNDLTTLKKLARRESWCFERDKDPFSILREYLKLTFYRLARQDKVVFTDQFAAFNTGLLDKRKEAIYALFQRNDARKSWMLQAWSTLNADRPGKMLFNLFGGEELPAAATYDMKDRFNPERNIHPRWEHVMEDGLRRRRYPLDFMMEYLPNGMPKTAPNGVHEDWCKEYVLLLTEDEVKLPDFKQRLVDAIILAKELVRQNPEAAVRNYYPAMDMVSVFLPLYLRGNGTPELALVVEDRDEKYYASTVYPLSWAYNWARVVGKPAADWLLCNKIVLSEMELEER